MEVSDLRAAAEVPLAAGDAEGARRVVRSTAGVSPAVAEQVVAYLAAGRAALGTLPTRDRLVVERFFDESEGSQLVVHSPYGGRINRALGLALRKRFCVSFDFELQAAADDDTVVLSLGPQHSFPLSQVPRMLTSRTAVDVLTQAVLPHPMLRARWRWNCNRALVVPRARAGQRRPIHLQRMDADDILAATWPALAACQENAPPGPIAVPDHVLVRQTVTDCLTEQLDAEGLVALLADIEGGKVEVHFVESAEPSVLSHGILTGRPFTFLDGAPLEERRSRAVPLSRGLGAAGPGGLPVPVDELAPLDGPASAAVLDQVRPRPRTADELHDLLLSLVRCRPVTAWGDWFDELAADGRAGMVGECWAATERRALAETIETDDEAAAECVRGHLELAGPVSEADLVGEGPLPPGAPLGAPLAVPRARTGLARLQHEGSAIQLPDGRWCARHLLVRLHAASRARRRRHVEPASIADLVRCQARWQHATVDTRLAGRAGVLAVIEQLAGIEVPAGDWEAHILPARVAGYEPTWLDELCLSGEVAWGRLSPRPDGAPRLPGAGPAGRRRGTATPSPATPLALVPRADLGWQLAAVRDGFGAPPPAPAAGASADVLAVLAARGRLLPGRAGAGGGTPARRGGRGAVGPGGPGPRHRRRLLRRAGPAGGPPAPPGRAALGPAGPGRPGPAPGGAGQRHRRGPVVAAGRRRRSDGRRRRLRGRPGHRRRGAGRGGGLPAAGPLGGGHVGAVGPRVLPHRLARRGTGPAAIRGARPGHGRAVRGRALRGAVRPPRRRRAAGPGAGPGRATGRRSRWPAATR